MNAEIVERVDAKVLGVMARINPMNADYTDLWSNRFGSRQREIAPLAIEEGCCGVYYGTDQEGMVDFVAGMVVDDVDRIPDGLTVREIPGGTYALFSCTMSTIGPTWNRIHSQWLPTADYVEDESRPSIEYYPASGEGADSPVTIYLAVTRK